MKFMADKKVLVARLLTGKKGLGDTVVELGASAEQNIPYTIHTFEVSGDKREEVKTPFGQEYVEAARRLVRAFETRFGADKRAPDEIEIEY